MPELVSCPQCARRLRVPDTLLNRTVKCPGCGQAFTATAAPGPIVEDAVIDEPPRRVESEAFTDRRPDEDDQEERRPRRRQQPDSDLDDDDEYDRRPRRRRRRSAAAESMVFGPAIALLVIGGLGIAAGILNVFLAVVGFGAGPAQNDAGAISGRLVGALLSLIWGVVVTMSGYKLKSLQSYGSVMTGVIFALLPCNPVCVIGIPIGIWALVVMMNQDVKNAFR